MSPETPTPRQRSLQNSHRLHGRERCEIPIRATTRSPAQRSRTSHPNSQRPPHSWLVQHAQGLPHVPVVAHNSPRRTHTQPLERIAHQPQAISMGTNRRPLRLQRHPYRTPGNQMFGTHQDTRNLGSKGHRRMVPRPSLQLLPMLPSVQPHNTETVDHRNHHMGPR